MPTAKAHPGPPDDRTAKARLRDAAIELVAEGGATNLSARRIAERAGLSAGLVTHHFGSMTQLQQAADKHVLAVIDRLKTQAMAGGLTFNPLAHAYSEEHGSLVGYVAQRLADPSPEVAAFVDDMIADAVGYLKEGENTGLVKPTDEPRDRAALMVLTSLGTLVMSEHFKRVFGVDLLSPHLSDTVGFSRYFHAVLDLYDGGILTDVYAAQLSTAVGSAEQEDSR